MDMIFITKMEHDTLSVITNEYVKHIIRQEIESKTGNSDSKPVDPVLIVCGSDTNPIKNTMDEFEKCPKELKEQNGPYMEIFKKFNHKSYINVNSVDELNNIFKETIARDTMFYIYDSDKVINPTDLIALKKQVATDSGQLIYMFASING